MPTANNREADQLSGPSGSSASGSSGAPSAPSWQCSCGYGNVGPLCTHCGDYRASEPPCACCGRVIAVGMGYCEECSVPFCHADANARFASESR
jgi:hypothetical protein